MKIALSICVPSYNRAHCLPDLMQSIVCQYDERVEIVICDNGSTDHTELLVQEWSRQYPRIVYYRFATNVGPDRCFLKSVEIASGTFCWLMGDDDIVELGGLATVLHHLDVSVTGYTVRRVAYDAALKNRWMEPTQGMEQDRDFHDAAFCLVSLFPFFGFLSAQVVRRSSWLSVVDTEDITPYYNAYVLIYVIGRMIQKHPHWRYIHTPCVGWRSGNDSFEKQLGMQGRFALDVQGYVTIARGLFAQQKLLYLRVMNRICSLHFVGHIRKLQMTGALQREKVLTLCARYLLNIPSFWYKLLPWIILPRGFFLKLKRPYRFIQKRWSGESYRMDYKG